MQPITQEFVYTQLRILLIGGVSYGAGKGIFTPTDATFAGVVITTVLPMVVPWFFSTYASWGKTKVPLGSVAAKVNVTSTGNSVTGSSTLGAAYAIGGATPSFTNCNTWNNSPSSFSGMSDPTGSVGNISADPDFSDTSSADPDDWDLTLQTSSPLIDAGSSALVDPDCSVSDIGAYAGTTGWWP